MRSSVIPLISISGILTTIFDILVDAQTNKTLALSAPNTRSPGPNASNPISPRQFPALAFWHPQLQRTALTFIAITTTPLLCTILATLYSKILDSVLNSWAQSPGKNQLVIEAGKLRWEFGCTVYPIPQRFLEEYYGSKRDAVKRGFAPVYAREWFWDKADVGRQCYAGMRIVEKGRDAVPPDLG
ncbi:MAG: hypothetical protein Q9166_000962 [cf. Caloplaca sp. 2 TL-2023]